jgi:hypothetical protein
VRRISLLSVAALSNWRPGRRYSWNHVDAWLVAQRSLVNAWTRSLVPVLTQRQALADHLARVLEKLGLDRTPKRVTDLQTYEREPGTVLVLPDNGLAMAHRPFHRCGQNFPNRARRTVRSARAYPAGKAVAPPNKAAMVPVASCSGG